MLEPIRTNAMFTVRWQPQRPHIATRIAGVIAATIGYIALAAILVEIVYVLGRV